jgi:hypothetical protein
MLVILRTTVFVIVMVTIVVPVLLVIAWLCLLWAALNVGVVRIRLRRSTGRFHLNDHL